MKRRRGQWCWSCQQTKPNEAFSGRNHGRHLCKACASGRRRAAREQRKAEAAAALAPAGARPAAPGPEAHRPQVSSLDGLHDEWACGDPLNSNTGVPQVSVMDLLEAALALPVPDRGFLAEQLVESLPADPQWFADLECRARRAITDAE